MHPKVLTVLKQASITYQEIRHDSFNVSITSPIDFANALNYSLDRITKSIFLRSKSKDKYIMAVCSISKKLNFDKLSKLAKVTKLEVADKQELANKVGYPTNGVCCIGVPLDMEVFIDDSLLTFQTVLIGSGEAAVEIELSPTDLTAISKATLANITL